jgi:hypothetical protein
MKNTKALREFKGVNKLDRFSIGENYAMSTKNLTSSNYPKFKVRLGYSQLGSTLAAKILGLSAWKDNVLHAISNGNWYHYSGGAWVSLASGLSASQSASFCNFKGNLVDISLIMANGVDFKYYNGTTIANLPTAPTGGNYVEQFADRLFCAVNNDLKASAYRAPDDWATVTVPESPTDSWYTTIETNNGESICAIKGGLSKLTIGKPNSLHELYGYDPTDYEVRTITLTVGPINNNCLLPLNGMMYVLHGTGFYRYQGGLIPDKKFSKPIQDYIDNINATAKSTCCLGTDGIKIYISIPVDSTTNPDTIIEFDPELGTFYVWKDMKPLNFARMGVNWYQGNYDGKVFQMGGSTSDAGTAITWEWITPPFTAPTMAQLMRWLSLWITANVATGTTFNVYISPLDQGDTDWTLIKILPASGVVESTPIYLAAQTKAQNAKYLRIKFSGSGPADLYEYTIDVDFNPLK